MRSSNRASQRPDVGCWPILLQKSVERGLEA
jgi:hypothetical protein